MSRDVGTFAESKRVQEMLESREAGAETAGPGPSSMNWQETFKGGKVQPTFGTFAKPGIKAQVRKHME
jgi:hypothetical protein